MPKKNNKTILVTGATGHQGGAVIRHLRERGFGVRALTRNPDKPEAKELGPGIEVVRGDLSDASSITRALDDIEGVFSVQDSTQGFDTEVQQGSNVAHAVNSAAVSTLVYSSVASADRNTQIPHFESKARIEEHIRNIGVRFAIFRPVFFMENLLQMREMIEEGTFAMPLAPDTRLQMIAVDDIGAFATMAFEHPGKWAGKVTELAGDELSMTEIAEHLGRITARPVKYSQVDWKDFEGRAGKEITTMFRWFESDGYHVDIASVRQQHAQLLSFDRWLDLTWRKEPATQKAGS